MPKIVVQTDDEDFAKLCRASDEQIHFVSLTQKEARKLCGDHALCVDDESGHGGDLDTALDYIARARMPKSEGSMDAEIVLRDMGEGRPHRYVTHQHNIAEGDTNGFLLGTLSFAISCSLRGFYDPR